MKSAAGFSLIEVMIALLVLGIGLVGITHGITTALSASKESELQTTAALLAAGQMEILRAEGYLVTGVTEGDGGSELPLYRWRQTVANSSVEGLHEVEVVVEHAKTGQAIYELRTLIFDPPLLSSANDSAEEGSGNRRRDREERRR
jgi:prepilin-type N-terminal cleavage/methylation domain-containing protein